MVIFLLIVTISEQDTNNFRHFSSQIIRYPIMQILLAFTHFDNVTGI